MNSKRHNSTLVLMFSLLYGCSEDKTAIHIRLNPDPMRNSQKMILSVIDKLTIILDTNTDEGFKGMDDNDYGSFVARNVDNDDALELELSRDLRGMDELYQL